MRIFIILLSLALFPINYVFAQTIVKKSKIINECTGFTFTEGPACDQKGRIFFTDQPNDKIYIWEEDKGIKTFLERTFRANGLYFNHKGDLVMCSDLNNQLIQIDDKLKFMILVDDYNGIQLNGPNDLWINSNGGVYFTDPYYHRNYWSENHVESQDQRGVYFLSEDGSLKRVVGDLKQPNGLIGTEDGKFLYVSDINDGKIWRYNILSNGDLSEKTLFVNMGSDGMTIDSEGNIYLASKEVRIYNSGGELIEVIDVPERPSNICFGGKKRNILFITARTSVYTLKTNVRGVTQK